MIDRNDVLRVLLLVGMAAAAGVMFRVSVWGARRRYRYRYRLKGVRRTAASPITSDDTPMPTFRN